jgi:hypothetical protein
MSAMPTQLPFPLLPSPRPRPSGVSGSFPSCSAGSAPMPWALGIWVVWVADVDLLVLATAGSSWFRA